ncbi:hypothetical protein JKF63_07870 [Porcisia hertigi]|uniref:Uncharacterized protein n=1 Tax=Porcisia hertigi TaxID=2761500 RepID=A0A837A944_9TRYP|nr:hypothetical protein JKF63_07870 [Porcisia hertigi]
MRTVTRSPLLDATTKLVIVIVATTLCFTENNGWVFPSGVRLARADGPITKEQCLILNPNPTVTDCSTYLPPVVDLYGALPYDTMPSYSQCVKERCVCTGVASGTDIQTVGLYCSSAGWKESGYVTCNRLSACFEQFWRCLNQAIYDRYINNRADLVQAEVDIMADIISHGNKPGEPFDVTDVFRSCRLSTCSAAKSRENCGLITCLPNYTQCDEYIRPPPLPSTHQFCTQGCRATLLMMALTIASFSFSLLCCCCCPAQVRISEPIVMGDTPAKKLESNSVSNEPGAPEGGQHSGRALINS